MKMPHSHSHTDNVFSWIFVYQWWEVGVSPDNLNSTVFVPEQPSCVAGVTLQWDGQTLQLEKISDKLSPHCMPG
jgi:hypothetical protein